MSIYATHTAGDSHDWSFVHLQWCQLTPPRVTGVWISYFTLKHSDLTTNKAFQSHVWHSWRTCDPVEVATPGYSDYPGLVLLVLLPSIYIQYEVVNSSSGASSVLVSSFSSDASDSCLIISSDLHIRTHLVSTYLFVTVFICEDESRFKTKL